MFLASSSLHIKEYLVTILTFLHHSNIEAFVKNMVTFMYQSCHSHVEVLSYFVHCPNPFIWSLLLALIFTVMGNSPSSALFVTPSLTFLCSNNLQRHSGAKSKHRSLQSSTDFLFSLWKLFTLTVPYLLMAQCPHRPCEILFLSLCLLSFIWGFCKEFQQRFLEIQIAYIKKITCWPKK